MFFNDVFSTVVITFLISLISVIILFCTTILCIIFHKKYHTKKFCLIYVIILLVSVFGIYISIPWLLLNKALHQTNNVSAVKYYNMALKTSIFPKVKATMYDFKSSHYFVIEKNLLLATENCEKFHQLKKDLPLGCMLWNMYLLNKDYDKAIANLPKNSKQIEAYIYLLKGDTDKAIDTINKEIDTNPKVWDYVYRANFYDYINRPDLSKKDYQKAIEIYPGITTHPTFKEIKTDKNYFFNKLEKNRKNFHLN